MHGGPQLLKRGKRLIPQAERAVRARSDHEFAERIEDHRLYRILVALQRRDLLLRLEIVARHCAVVGGHRQDLA